MFLIKLFSWLSSLFGVMKRIFNRFSDEEKSLSIKASSIVAIINKNITEAPAVVSSLLQSTYPDLTQEQLEYYLVKAKRILGLPDSKSETWQDHLKDIQAYLFVEDRNVWVSRSQALVGALINLFLPDSPVEKILSILEYIYQKIVKEITKTPK